MIMKEERNKNDFFCICITEAIGNNKNYSILGTAAVVHSIAVETIQKFNKKNRFRFVWNAEQPLFPVNGNMKIKVATD